MYQIIHINGFNIQSFIKNKIIMNYSIFVFRNYHIICITSKLLLFLTFNSSSKNLLQLVFLKLNDLSSSYDPFRNL